MPWNVKKEMPTGRMISSSGRLGCKFREARKLRADETRKP